MGSEKIFLTNSPALPGTCAICNNHLKDGQEFLDFGVSLDWYGAVLICPFCMVNAAELVGFAPVAEAISTLPLEAEITALRLKVQVLETFVASYASDPTFTLDSFLSSRVDVPLEFEFAGDHEDGIDADSRDESELDEPATV